MEPKVKYGLIHFTCDPYRFFRSVGLFREFYTIYEAHENCLLRSTSIKSMKIVCLSDTNQFYFRWFNYHINNMILLMSHPYLDNVRFQPSKMKIVLGLS